MLDNFYISNEQWYRNWQGNTGSIGRDGKTKNGGWINSAVTMVGESKWLYMNFKSTTCEWCLKWFWYFECWKW